MIPPPVEKLPDGNVAVAENGETSVHKTKGGVPVIGHGAGMKRVTVFVAKLLPKAVGHKVLTPVAVMLPAPDRLVPTTMDEAVMGIVLLAQPVGTVQINEVTGIFNSVVPLNG